MRFDYGELLGKEAKKLGIRVFGLFEAAYYPKEESKQIGNIPSPGISSLSKSFIN